MARLALVLLLLLAVAASAWAGAGASHLDLGLGFLSSGDRRRECRGTVAECLDESEGLDLGAGPASVESHRRALYGGGGGYISYGALRRDNVPCSRRGASYYNCRPGGQANPYHRGCSRITRCRG
ncbi:RALF precursor [Zea mays]|jgi:hypothetical protein|uniref:RALF n=1 Tax=Zea mays TaxID=4577 RepID=A0A1D6MXM3_MAIZE|nr:RALF precursor [Zea mays]ONM33475.1 RALF [Zea mays]|eukprot:NP_001147163.2 RALF precursor [Zea mays]